MSVSLWQHKKNPQALTTDFLIIGGGISGLGLAHFLEKSGASTLVVEKSSLASGASGRNAGFLSMGSVSLFQQMVQKYGQDRALAMRNFYKSNHELLLQEIIKNPKKVDYQKQGSLSLLFEPQEEHLCETVGVLNHHGFNLSYQSSKEVKKSVGVVNTRGGFLDTDDGEVNAFKLVQEIASNLKNSKILEQEEVFLVTDQEVLTTNYKIKYKTLIFALNGYSSLLIPQIAPYLKPVRGQMLSLAPAPKFMHHNVYASKMLCYFRQLPTGELVMGGFRTLEEKTEVGFDDLTTTPVIQGAFENFIKSYLPQVQAPVKHRWAGIMGFSFDENPLVGQLSPNQFLLGGYHGHGMGKAFACAKALSELILHQKTPPDFISLRRLKLTSS